MSQFQESTGSLALAVGVAGAGYGGVIEVDGGTARRASASGERARHSTSPTRTRASAGRSKADSKRTCLPAIHTPVSLSQFETAVDECYTPVEGSSSELDEAAMKTEVAVSSKADLAGSFPVETVPGGCFNPPGDGLCADLDGSEDGSKWGSNYCREERSQLRFS